jgi:hypothetical protein
LGCSFKQHRLSVSLVLRILGMFVMCWRFYGYLVYNFSWTLVQLCGVVDNIMASSTWNWVSDICQSNFSFLYVCTYHYRWV